MPGPNMKKVLDLESDVAWDAHLNDSYQKTQKEHSKSWTSWGKTRLRKGERVDTAFEGADKAGFAIGTVAGGVALGVTMGAAAAATLYALPVVVTGGALLHWGYKKNEHHTVNEAIWKWWSSHQKNGELDPKETAKLEEAKEWLGWFGDEGISNMNHLNEKLKEAKDAFDNSFKSIQASARNLQKRIDAVPQLKDTQQKRIALQSLQSEEDALAKKYLGLGQDLEYIRYRLERMLMYNQMLEVTVRSLLFHTKDQLAQLAKNTREAFNKQTDSYSDLWYEVTALDQASKRVAKAAGLGAFV